MRSLPYLPLTELGAGLPCSLESQVEVGGLPRSLAEGLAVGGSKIASWDVQSVGPFLPVPPISCAWWLPPGTEPGQCLSGQTPPFTHRAPQLGEGVAAFGLV